jgi:hypothetical protein
MFSKLIRLAVAGASVGAVLASVAPAQAHSPTFQIAGFQYLWMAEFEGGHAGKLGVPVVGPQDVDAEAPGIEPASASLEEGIGDIVNNDPLAHTFTECNVACDTAVAGAGADPAFDIAVPSVSSAQFTLRANIDGSPRQLEAKTYTFFCKVHPFMRGEVVVSG